MVFLTSWHDVKSKRRTKWMNCTRCVVVRVPIPVESKPIPPYPLCGQCSRMYDLETKRG